MSFLSEVEKRIERGFRRWTEQIFGPAPSDDLFATHRAILEDIEARLEPGFRGKRTFPYNRIVVRVAEQWQAPLTQERRLERDIRELLDAAGVQPPQGFAVEVEPGAETFAIDYRVAAPEPKAQHAGHARLVFADGSSAALTRARTNVGRIREILDRQQRPLRRNDVVFDEQSGDPNSTVSRQHAHISFDPKTGEYRVCDDGSEYGTGIFRNGERIDVPAANRRGERLRPGDEIYFGRAMARFEVD